MPNDRSALGRAGEDAAAAFLTARGWQVLARNVRRREGEVDIVARRGSTLAFVEVKTRRTTAYGTPGEAVTYRKRSRIRGIAAAMLAEGITRASVVRFDVIEARPGRDGAFAIHHIEAAF
ncbi:MAG: YraN family protein [Actinomycetota bacterium]